MAHELLAGKFQSIQEVYLMADRSTPVVFFLVTSRKQLTSFLLVLPDSEALKMRIWKLGLERTSVCDLARPPSLVYHTTETMTCNNNENSNQQ